MYLVIRNGEGNVDKVYGYMSISDIYNYAVTHKQADENLRWDANFPQDYTGDVIYLPVEDE